MGLEFEKGGERDTEIGSGSCPPRIICTGSPLPSPGPSPRAIPQALVLSNSGKRIDQAAGKKKYVKQVTGRHNDTELHLAAQRGDVAAVRQILSAINALMTGTTSGADFDSEVAEIRSAMVNEVNEVGETALFVAAERGHLEVVVELLKYADKDGVAAKNRSGLDALHAASREGHHVIVQVLVDHDPTLSRTFGPSNTTPLISAATRGHRDVVNMLLAQDSGMVELAKTNGKNALHFASRQGHIDVVKALLDKDPQLARRTDKKGQTALHMAVKGTNCDVVKALVDADPAIVMLPDKFGNTALHVATRKKRAEIVSVLLLLPDTHVNALTRDHKTAFDIAENLPLSEEAADIKECLSRHGAVRANDLNQPRDELRKTVTEIKKDVHTQLEQTRKTNKNVHGIAKEIRKLHREGINNATNSVTVVAVLFATVAFAAIFTVPGGADNDGVAVTVNTASFKIFFIFNAIALFTSLAVVVVQITLVRGETKSERRVVGVINKLMWLASVCTTVAFIASSYIVVGRHFQWAAILVTVVVQPFVSLPTSTHYRGQTPSRFLRSICNAAGAAQDNSLLLRAAEVADRSAGHTAPHPNFGCVIAVNSDVVGEGFLFAQGTKCAELQAVETARELARGATAYLNMEPGDCYGDQTSVSSLVQAGISRVVVGIRNPLGHLRGKAINSLRSEGVQVEVVGEDLPSKKMEMALKSCLVVNAPLLYRAAFHIPFSVLKYAMTLDGKIAASSGDASWVSSKLSRGRVFDLRGRSDAVVVGGNTVRRDDPRLTARHGGCHVPARIVMSKSLNLPDVANLWNTHDAYTIVATQRGAQKDVQEKLAKKGVEVVEFDMLNPRDVMEYCYNRGCLSILWECGGELAAPAITSGVIHKVYAFIAPKIIGGRGAPSPVGELGMVQMSQALDLIDVSREEIGPDILISGFLQPIPDLSPVIPSIDETAALDPTVSPFESKIIFFYKTWDPFGAFSNFSPHSIWLPDETGDSYLWPTVEHYYQAQKFVGVDNPVAKGFIEQIKFARSPEEAARIGRKVQKEHRELIHPDWEKLKIDVMYRGLRCKFSTHAHLNSLLRSTAGLVLVEASPHDLFWGGGREGEGLNYLGRLLMELRSEILEEVTADSLV